MADEAATAVLEQPSIETQVPASPPQEAPAAPPEQSSEAQPGRLQRLFTRITGGESARAPEPEVQDAPPDWEPPAFKTREEWDRHQQSIGDRAVFQWQTRSRQQELSRLNGDLSDALDREDFMAASEARATIKRVEADIKAIEEGDSAYDQVAKTLGQQYDAHTLNVLRDKLPGELHQQFNAIMGSATRFEGGRPVGTDRAKAVGQIADLLIEYGEARLHDEILEGKSDTAQAVFAQLRARTFTGEQPVSIQGVPSNQETPRNLDEARAWHVAGQTPTGKPFTNDMMRRYQTAGR